jgi:rhodanese-related sulfurtransferase
MTQRGYDKVYNLHGGIVSWVHHGLPVVQMNIS